MRLADGDNVLIVTGLIRGWRDVLRGRGSGRGGGRTSRQASKSLPVSLLRATSPSGCGPRSVVRLPPVGAGELVHTHNLASDYLPTFAHRGGAR